MALSPSGDGEDAHYQDPDLGRPKEVREMMFGYGVHGAWWIPMSLGTFVFLGLTIWVIYVFTGLPSRMNRSGPCNREARTALDQRLALGEIDEEEFARLRDLIFQADTTSVDRTDSGG
jgi:uncharacterized membrane protein